MVLKENVLDVDTYLMLRGKVKWKPLTKEQAKKALENSLYTVVAYENGKPVGMGRVVGDRAVICYVQDLIVIPEYQGSGIGYRLLQNIKEFVLELKIPGTEMMFDLMCAKGREHFYKKCGIHDPPQHEHKSGMKSHDMRMLVRLRECEARSNLKVSYICRKKERFR